MITFQLIKEMKPNIQYMKMREENDDFCVILTKQMELLFLNSVSLDFIKLVDGKKNVSEITNKLFDIYDVERDLLENDIVVLIKDLQWKEILYFTQS